MGPSRGWEGKVRRGARRRWRARGRGRCGRGAIAAVKHAPEGGGAVDVRLPGTGTVVAVPQRSQYPEGGLGRADEAGGEGGDVEVGDVGAQAPAQPALEPVEPGVQLDEDQAPRVGGGLAGGGEHADPLERGRRRPGR